MPKIVVSTLSKNDLIIVLIYLGKLSLQIHTKINRIKKNDFLYLNLQIVFQTKWKLIDLSHLKIKFLFSYILTLFVNLSVVTAQLRQNV